MLARMVALHISYIPGVRLHILAETSTIVTELSRGFAQAL
jgi:hypothetical protein